MIQIKSVALNQAAVEQATGLSREVLRKWEQRYQFPVPGRDARGQRLYSAQDVEKLQLIQRLVHCGMRPGKLVPLPFEQLQTLLTPHRPVAAAAQLEAAVTAFLATLAPGAPPHALQQYLERQIKENGLAHFVDQQMPAFNQAVGEAWAADRLAVHGEHYYTEIIRNIVLRSLTKLQPAHLRPRVLLTTPPGELHGLGLLALQAALTLHGADCICLGTQTPAMNVLQAARDFNTPIVAVSASIGFPPDAMRTYVQTLRQGLPATCALWVGGKGSEFLSSQATEGFEVFETTQQALQIWLQRHQKANQSL